MQLKVIYRRTYPAYDITGTGYEPLITKSDVWAYEAEWRIVAEERDNRSKALGTIKTDDGFLTLPPGALKSIIIGCQAPERSRELVASLVRGMPRTCWCVRRHLASDSYDLVVAPPVA